MFYIQLSYPLADRNGFCTQISQKKYTLSKMGGMNFFLIVSDVRYLLLHHYLIYFIQKKTSFIHMLINLYIMLCTQVSSYCNYYVSSMYVPIDSYSNLNLNLNTQIKQYLELFKQVPTYLFNLMLKFRTHEFREMALTCRNSTNSPQIQTMLHKKRAL